MERTDQLTDTGWQFFYDDTLFPPGTDTFLLSDFPVLRSGLRVCDLGSGSGLLGLLLLRRQRQLSVTGVELQEKAVRLARKTAAVNGLEECLSTVHADLRTLRGVLPAGSFQLVVSNPPYYPSGSGPAASGTGRRLSRSEDACTLDDICQAASYLLQWSGRFCLVCKPARLTDLFCALRVNGLEAKRLQLIYPRPNTPPSLALTEGRRGGRPGLTIEPSLILQCPD